MRLVVALVIPAALAGGSVRGSTEPPVADINEVAEAQVSFTVWLAVEFPTVDPMDAMCFVADGTASCAVRVEDGDFLEATASVGIWEWSTDYVDLHEAATPIADAAIVCSELSIGSDHAGTGSRERFTVLDAGHSVVVQDFIDRQDGRMTGVLLDCMLDELGLPAWITYAMTGDQGRVDVPGYTVLWDFSGESYAASSLIVVDDAAGGGAGG